MCANAQENWAKWGESARNARENRGKGDVRGMRGGNWKELGGAGKQGKGALDAQEIGGGAVGRREGKGREGREGKEGKGRKEGQTVNRARRWRFCIGG